MSQPNPVLPSPVFCAIDTPSMEAAGHLAHQLRDLVGGLKLGLEFFGANGPAGVRQIAEQGPPLFLDLKLHDIPNTVASAVRTLVPLEPAYLTLHAAGGRAMLEAAVQAAREAAEEAHVARPRLLGVTVLTSLDENDLHDLGQDPSPMRQADRLAFLAQDAGLDGVVCSAHEIAHLRRRHGPDFLLAVPGIRPSWTTHDDQKRVTTPAEALELGANLLVIGRPITRATDPAEAARQIAEELAGAAS
ncbi:MAG: orotidine-5'-phosphate decarboxylase [Rhodospirillaceae bacterium]|nr:orotidine-5'-phosphate decarboxylase [Rhodospirillaceae bacterium]